MKRKRLAFLALFVATAFAAQQPQDVFLPDHLGLIEIAAPVYANGTVISCLATATYYETVADLTGIRPTITRKKGTVQIDLVAIAAQKWAEVNPPALPTNPPIAGVRRTLRNPPPPATDPPP